MELAKDQLNDNTVVTDSENTGVSMVEILEEETQLEDDANAVLGGSDHRNCTYLMGYVDRQAVYSCSTCSGEGSEPAMICLACSYECHEGHDLHELYTKRSFCCDCGNEKFQAKCKLSPEKRPRNEGNKYNQNFRGLYCVCHRPYPDPEDEVADEMIQCVICEDWYHGRHLGALLPEQSDYGEMTCGDCLKHCDFLRAYAIPCEENIKLNKEESDEQVVVVSDKSRNVEKEPQVQTEKTNAEDIPSSQESQATLNENNSPTVCQYRLLMAGKLKKEQSGAIFWTDGWRKKLCCCDQCKEMYEDKKVAFLTDAADSVSAYEELGKTMTGEMSQYDRGMQQFSQMDRTHQVEMLQGYHDMKTELNEYLRKFAENKKVVREEDIREFFSKMVGRKKARVNPPQHFCR